MISSDVRHVGICLNLFGLLSRKIKLFDILGVMLQHLDHSVGSLFWKPGRGSVLALIFRVFVGMLFQWWLVLSTLTWLCTRMSLWKLVHPHTEPYILDIPISINRHP